MRALTLLPSDNRDVKGLIGPQFPNYRVGPVCAVPGCSHFADDVHHLWRRSFLCGVFSWVELWDHTIVGNVVALCHDHHRMVTEAKTWIRWDDESRSFWWCDQNAEMGIPLAQQPPLHSLPLPDEQPEVIYGPASRPVCPGCGRPLPLPRGNGTAQEPRRRKTWTVTVPNDNEDGALVLDTLLDECRRLFAHDDQQNTRYFTLVQALALVLQHAPKIS